MVSATTLVLPQLAIDAAQAAPVADVSITKTVASLSAPLSFNPSLSDTRATGHYEWTPGGLHIWTEGASSTDKVAEYVDTSTPLSAVGEPSLDYTKIAPPTAPNLNIPGFQLVTDFDGNGTADGILIGEPIYNGDWWLSNGSPQWVKDLAPSHTGGSGSANHGTLTQWRAAFASAKVLAYGFSLGSGVLGEGYLTGLTFAGTHYDLTRQYAPTLKTAPGDTVEYKITIANNGGAQATGIEITDVLPSDVTYVAGSLSRPDWCSVATGKLTCTGGILPPGTSSDVLFRAKISSTVTSANLQATTGHNVDVQKQEVFADLPAGKTKTYSAMCPAGYLPTDGGLLVDSVDQDGFYSDLVVSSSKPVEVSGVKGWSVTVTNYGEQRGQGKVKVTCLDQTIGSSDGHTHDIVVAPSTGVATIAAASTNPTDTVTRTCAPGYTPVAPQFETTSGIATVRGAYATANTFTWTVDHDPGTAATFDVSCLAPTTTSTNGHTASLSLNTEGDTISVGPEGRVEGIQQCLTNAHAIVGGYEGTHASVLSLGREQRGNNYMFRFYNDDWDQAHNAKIQATCVGVRTPDEPRYYHILNTATVRATEDPTSSSSTADISIVGGAVPPSGMTLGTTGSLVLNGQGKTTAVRLRFVCPAGCSMSIRVSKAGTVVAKGTKSLPASPATKTVDVPTTSAGRNLGAGQVSVKLTTEDGNSTKTVTLS